MISVGQILELFMVIAVVFTGALVVSNSLDRLLGLSPNAERRYPTRFLERARRWLPVTRAFIWVVAVVLVTAFALSRRPRQVALIVALPLALGIGFGLRDYLANIIGGITLAMNRPFKLGDRIEIDGITGVVASIGLAQTRLTTSGGREVRLPNRRLIADGYRMSRTGYRDVAAEILLSPPAGMELAEAKKTAYTSAIVSRYASPRRRPEVFVETDADTVQLRVRAYACDPAHLDTFRSEITEIWLEAIGGDRGKG